MEPFTLLAGAAAGAGGMYLARRLITTPRQEEGLADILGWAFLVDDGVVLMKDGAVLAGMTIRGRDLASATTGEVNAAARAVNDALSMIGTGYAVEVNMHRRKIREYPPLENNDFCTAALWTMERERKAQFESGEHFVTENTVLVSWVPPPETTRKWSRLMVQGQAATLDYPALLRAYKDSVGEVSERLSSTFEVRRLDSAALLRECHACLTGHHHAVHHTPTQGSYLSTTLASVDFTPGYHPVVGEDTIHVVTVTSLGAETQAALTDFFHAWRGEARWHMRFIPMSRFAAEKRIRTLQTRWFHQRKGLRAVVMQQQDAAAVVEDQDAIAMQAETGEALAALMSGRASFGYFSNALVVRAKRREEGATRARTILQLLRDHGLTCKVETMNATSAFFGTLPGHGYHNVRRPLLSSRNVAHLFPVTTPWAGEGQCPSPLFPEGSPPLLVARAYGATPFRVNLHQGDVGHTLVIGATGAGKSVLVGTLALNFMRYRNSRVFVFDVGGSHRIPTLAAGGHHYDFGGEGNVALQPLRYLDREGEQVWAQTWIETLLEGCNHPVVPADVLQITTALRGVGQSPVYQRTMTSLHINLSSRLREVLLPYTVLGNFGRFLDDHTERMEVKRFQTFELREVIDLGDRLVVPLLLALFRHVERSLDGTPTLIVIEEAWAALMRSTFANRLQEWLLTLRKRNAAVLVVIHTVGQLKELPNASLLMESCPTRIILPNPDAGSPSQAEVYRYLSLSDREIDIIASARQKRDYFYKSPSGSRLFDLQLGRMARALTIPLGGMTTEESQKHLAALHAEHAEHFLDHIPLDS